jgi:mannose-6-phosphate isomerase
LRTAYSSQTIGKLNPPIQRRPARAGLAPARPQTYLGRSTEGRFADPISRRVGVAAMPLYPLQFEPIYKAKVWGGRRLAEQFGRDLPGDEMIGESWELVDLGETSVSGGGGGAERSDIANGPLAGRTIHDAMVKHGPQLMGLLAPTDDGGFPLLVKFLDAGANLSVQVHPSEDYARQNAGAFLKSEAWYIVAAEPGAVIYKGVKQGTTPDQFRRALRDNTVEDLLIKVEVHPGDMHYLPSGTCHALGAGIMVAEVQTPSDTTFRVYDWGRTGRELHIEQAMECIHFGPAETARYEPGTKIENENTLVEAMVRCEHFHVDRVTMPADYGQRLSDAQPVVWMVLEGAGRITCRSVDETDYAPGNTLLLPAAMTHGEVHVDVDTTLLEITFPQVASDLLT